MDYHISEVPSRTSILCDSFGFAEHKSIGWADNLSTWQPYIITLRSLYFTMCSLSYMLCVFVVNLSLRHVWDVSSLFWIKLKHMFWLSDPRPPPPSLLFLQLSPSTRHRPVNRVSSSLLHSPLSPFDPVIDWLQQEDSTRPTRANSPRFSGELLIKCRAVYVVPTPDVWPLKVAMSHGGLAASFLQGPDLCPAGNGLV